jgi:hypothetical protein
MSLNNNVLNGEYFSTSKKSSNVDLYGVHDSNGRLYKFKKDIWNTNKQWNEEQQRINTINNDNYGFCSATQIHTGEILGVGRDRKLYKVSSNLTEMIELIYDDEIICCFNSVTQLNDYRILLVGSNGWAYCIDSIKNPRWYRVEEKLNNLQKLKQQGFSSVLANYKNDKISVFKFNSNSTKNIIGSELYAYGGIADSAVPYYDDWIKKFIVVGDNQQLYREYFNDKKVEGKFGGKYIDVMWFDNQRIKPQNLINYKIDLPIKDGLVGYYNADSFVNGYWFDLTTNNNHVVYLSNNIKKYKNRIYGQTNSYMIFPTEILPPKYTLFHISRYNGENKKRIFQGLKNNWLSGFHEGKTGVAYHDGWITESEYKNTYHFGQKWILSTDQNSLYRANMHDLTKSDKGKTSAQLAINIGDQPKESSNWQCACVIVFDRTLSQNEIEKMETFLISKYQDLFTDNMENLGFSNFYSVDPNDKNKKTIGKILKDDELSGGELYNVKQVKFICPSLDGKKCLNSSDTDFKNMQEYGNKIPILPDIKEIQCKTSYSDDKQNIYLNKFIRYNNGAIFYIDNKGVVRPIKSMKVYNDMLGKNGCPNERIQLDTNDFKTLGTFNPPLVQGSTMRTSESCISPSTSNSDDEPNLANNFKFLNDDKSIDGGVCKNIFDIYNLYPTKNKLAIVNPSINSSITNTIEDHNRLTELASQYSGSFTNINTDDDIKSSINQVLENTPLKLACCKRIPSDNTQKSAKIFTSLSPDINSKNKTLSELNWQNSQFTVPANTCPTNLYKGSADCNVFHASYCANMYDYLQSKGLKDKDKLLQIPECACYFPNTKEQEFYPAGTPSVCYKEGCNSGEAYIDPSSMQPDGSVKQCDMTVCQNIVNTAGLTAGGSANINPTLKNNCGQFIPEDKPSDQTQPVNQTQPTQPVNQTQPTQPVDQTQPTQPVDQTQPVNQTQPTQPVDQTQPTQPVDQTQPTQPANQTQNDASNSSNFIIILTIVLVILLLLSSISVFFLRK